MYFLILGIRTGQRQLTPPADAVRHVARNPTLSHQVAKALVWVFSMHPFNFPRGRKTQPEIGVCVSQIRSNP